MSKICFSSFQMGCLMLMGAWLDSISWRIIEINPRNGCALCSLFESHGNARCLGFFTVRILKLVKFDTICSV